MKTAKECIEEWTCSALWDFVESVQQDALTEPKRLLKACLDTGGLRKEELRKLYLDVCAFIGEKPEVF